MTRSLFSTLAGAALLVAVSAAPEYKKPETTCTDTPVPTYPAKHTGYPAEYPAKYPASQAYPVSKGYPAHGEKPYPGHGEKPYPAASTSCTEEASYPTGTYVKYPVSTYAPSKEYPASYEGEYPVPSSTCTDEYPSTYTGQAIPTGYTTKVVYATSAYPTSTCTMNAYNSSYCTTSTKYDTYPVATTLCPIEEAYPTSTAYPVYTTSTIYSTSCYDVTTYDNNKAPMTYKTTEYIPVSTTVCPVEETYPATHAAESYPKPTGSYGSKPVGGSYPESYPAGGNATSYPAGTGAYGAKPTYAVSAGAMVSAAPALAAAAALSLFMGLMA